MRQIAVTSFGAYGERLGVRSVKSFLRHWPLSVPLIVYVDRPVSLKGVPVRYTDDIEGWRETRRILPSVSDDLSRYKPLGYLWNAARFAVKPFVWWDVAERMQSGILTWLDADTVTKQDVPEGFAETLLDGCDVAYLGRGEMHPETGYVGFRLPEALPLIRWCRQAYINGMYQSLNGWTDCHVLRAGLKAVPVRAKDWTSDQAKEWTSRVDAMKRSPLGPYVDHLKGKERKREAAC